MARSGAGIRAVVTSVRGSIWLAVAAMVAAVTLWGPSFVATKVALRELPPLTIAFLRFFVASCVLYPVWRLSRRATPLGAATHRRLFVGALLGVTGYFIVENLGVQRTTAGDAALLMAAIPVIVLVVEAIWLKQAVSLIRSTGVVLSFGGVFLLIRDGQVTGGSNRLLGDLLVIAAAFLWAGYSLLGRTLERVPKLAVVTYQAMYGTAMLAPIAVVESRQWHAVSWSAVLAVAYLGVLCSAVTYLLYNQALKTLAASQVTAFLNLVPVVGAAAAVLLLDEQLQLVQVLGGAVILTGVVMSARSRSKLREPARGTSRPVIRTWFVVWNEARKWIRSVRRCRPTTPGLRLWPKETAGAARMIRRRLAAPRGIRRRNATRCPTPPSWQASAAATRTPWPNFARAKPPSISARERASTCCCRAKRVGPTG